MLIFWPIPVITKQCFQNIRRTFDEFSFQKYYENAFMKLKRFVGYPVKFLILAVSSVEMFF